MPWSETTMRLTQSSTPLSFRPSNRLFMVSSTRDNAAFTCTNWIQKLYFCYLFRLAQCHIIIATYVIRIRSTLMSSIIRLIEICRHESRSVYVEIAQVPFPFSECGMNIVYYYRLSLGASSQPRMVSILSSNGTLLQAQKHNVVPSLILMINPK